VREAAIFLLAFVAYAALGQDALYRDDGFLLLGRLAERSCSHTSHEAFLPQLVAFGDLLAPLRLPPHRVATLFSALGTAAGVALTDRAMRLLEPAGSGRPLLATALVASAPAVVFFATVVEYHGWFFAFAQLAFLAAAWLARRPGVARGVVLGTCTAGATLVHSSGALLPALLLPCVLALSRSGGPRTPRLRSVLAAAGVHLALVPLGIAVLRALHIGRAPDPAPVLWMRARIDGLPAAVWHEWLLPFALVSVGSLAGLARRPTRRLAGATWTGVAVYAAFAACLLGGLRERGAYLLPLAAPAALTCARAMPRAAGWIMVACAAAAAVAQVRVHDGAAAEYARFARGLEDAAAGRPAVALVVARTERAACATLPLAVPCADLGAWVHVPAEHLAAGKAALPAALAALVPQEAPLLVSDASLQALRAATPQARALADALLACFPAARVDVPGFRGYRLSRPR
jgi:hypothetical protein